MASSPTRWISLAGMRGHTSQRHGEGPSRTGLGGAELALAALVVGVVAMMIVPLPTWLLDVLLATNLSLSVAILLVVLYVPDALAIATFPTVLLLTTLFRLALNVSSSRLILLQANAGDVIKAFGGFVVRGNYVVGAVVFLILTVIQFIVIAKGSERVAEVAARFVLDAMPGKQMAIDAEVRSGTIDGNEARRTAILRTALANWPAYIAKRTEITKAERDLSSIEASRDRTANTMSLCKSRTDAYVAAAQQRASVLIYGSNDRAQGH